jgi:hypothetical protein
MDNNEDQAFLGKPAGYSPTSTAELASKAILEKLLNKQRIKPHLTENDKTPNFDGSLVITDANGTPTGKIDVQLKTLPEKYHDAPRFHYSRPFIAACFQNLNPPILIAVDITNEIAYWHHISLEVISDFISERRESHILPFLPQNIIDGKDEQYVDAWQVLFDRALETKLNSSAQKDRIEKLEAQAREAAKYIEPAQLPEKLIREVHHFLDFYNDLLEQDFKSIRSILYPRTWKIGIAIGDYSVSSVSHMLLPIPYTKNEPLIVRFKHLPDTDLFNLWVSHGIRSLAMTQASNPISSYPLKYAYELLQDDILSTISKEHFPIDDTFAASEYLTSFIDTFSNYLGYEPFAPSYDLDHLKELLEIILPAHESTNRQYRSGLTEFIHHIDSNSNNGFRWSNRQLLETTRERLKNGFAPPIQVTLQSTLFDLDLISYYLHFLRASGLQSFFRPFLPNLTLDRRTPRPDRWNRSALLDNLKIFMENYPRVYTGLLSKNFPLLAGQLALEEASDLTVYTILSEYDPNRQPIMMKYSLKAMAPAGGKRTLFFHEAECPIDGREMFRTKDYHCRIEGEEYEVVYIQTNRLDFLLASSPVFTYAHETLTEKMKSYLDHTLKSLK